MLDDEAAIAKLLEVVLRHAGLGPTRVYTDPSDALRAIRRDPPDLLLLDLSMPKVDGFTVLAEVREAPVVDWPIPVLVLTAEPAPATRERALLMGAWGFIRKPFDPAVVASEARRLLEVPRTARGEGLGALVRRELDALAARGCASLIDDRLPAGTPGPEDERAYRAVSLVMGALAARAPRSVSVRVEPSPGGITLTARALSSTVPPEGWDADLRAALPGSWWTATEAQPGEVVLELFVPSAAATGTAAG